MLSTKYYLYLFTALLFLFKTAKSQDLFAKQKEAWLKIAEQYQPKLEYEAVAPKSIVNIVKDENAFQGYKAVKVNGLDSLNHQSFNKLSQVIVDFGAHYTGYCEIDFKILKGTADAPTRLKFTFGEVPSEIMAVTEKYTGVLSKGWTQEEIINIESIPYQLKLPRRVAGRYLKIELLGASPWFEFAIDKITLNTTTSASGWANQFRKFDDPLITKIDSVSVLTLKECMQTVFEDGPKRDQRLWIGDLYLQSLANNYSFKSHDLTKRSLYLLAALSDSLGYLPSNVFEKPYPHAQKGAHIIDYSLLYIATLKEYVSFSKDLNTGNDLWPLALHQFNYLMKFVNQEGKFNYAEANKNGGSFFDWHPDLDKETATQAILIFAAKELISLAKSLDKVKEVEAIQAKISLLANYLISHNFDEKQRLFVSGAKNQVSYASQIWVVLADILPKKTAKEILINVSRYKNAVKPVTPYLHHYYVQALINTKQNAAAAELLKQHWGSMIQKGADTFWEVNVVDNDFSSPYNFYPINSYCHAWSCTPMYFIRKYPEIFQKSK
ncbi:family 78 glycoside hydrolase catalytic domain [Pedobacter glucosidilyticus]|uniref:alpha-L-rhamnosidase-related protein n=1 Tax=Pedobacter glucosidilyticus TaxID=1122941 RepID=UPI00041FF7C2|nr:family 78 glycoside hydrolase catalytic domain [Pedobacter glucosidilyticus]